MSERKVLNKYIPPDFDPSKLGKSKKPKQSKIRTMLGLKVQCNHCGTNIPPDRKLNCRKETVEDRDYLGIPIFRFYFKCPNCHGEFSTITDPKNSEYSVEFGARRCYESCSGGSDAFGGEEDRVKSLRRRAFELKREMDRDNGVSEIRLIKSRQERVSVDDMIEALGRGEKEMEFQEEEDEAVLVRKFMESRRQNKSFIRRICDHDDVDESGSCSGKEEGWRGNLKRRKVMPDFKASLFKVFVVRKPFVASKVGDDSSFTGLHLLGQNYGSDDVDT